MVSTNTASVDVLTTGLGPFPAEVGRVDMQAFPVRVMPFGQAPEVHVVVSSQALGSSDLDRLGTSIRMHFRALTAIFLIHDSPGRAEVLVVGDPEAGYSEFSVAAAVAVLKRSGFWDEADPIRISLAKATFPVSVRRGANGWEASTA